MSRILDAAWIANELSARVESWPVADIVQSDYPENDAGFCVSDGFTVEVDGRYYHVCITETSDSRKARE